MELKRFIVAFSAFLVTTILLFLAGYMYTIPWLMLHRQYTDSETDLLVITGAAIPVFIGIMAGFIAEKLYTSREK